MRRLIATLALVFLVATGAGPLVLAGTGAGVLSALAPAPAHAGKLRTKHYWGGPDLPVSCDQVRAWRGMVVALSSEARRALIRKFRVTPKMLRQAKACLK